MSEEKEKLVSLRQKIEGVDEFLRGEVEACRRSSKIVGIVGIIIVVALAIYFGWLYSEYKGIFRSMEDYLEPTTLASLAQDEFSKQLPELLDTTEEYLLKHSADLIEKGKDQLLKELPTQ